MQRRAVVDREFNTRSGTEIPNQDAAECGMAWHLCASPFEDGSKHKRTNLIDRNRARGSAAGSRIRGAEAVPGKSRQKSGAAFCRLAAAALGRRAGGEGGGGHPIHRLTTYHTIK